jgi:hypothetical protein
MRFLRSLYVVWLWINRTDVRILFIPKVTHGNVTLDLFPSPITTPLHANRSLFEAIVQVVLIAYTRAKWPNPWCLWWCGWIALYRRNKLPFGIQSSYTLEDVSLYFVSILWISWLYVYRSLLPQTVTQKMCISTVKAVFPVTQTAVYMVPTAWLS